MTPRFRIIANGANITPLIKDRLVHLTVKDEAGTTSNTASIILNDQDNRLAFPKKGAEFEIHMGHSGIGMIPMGLFTVETLSISGPPDRLTIKAKSLQTHQTLTENRVDNYNPLTIGELVTTIAARHKLIPNIPPSLASIPSEPLSQNEESDLHLLTRIAKNIGAVVKTTPRHLLFTPKEHAKGAPRETLTPVVIKKKTLSTYKFLFPDIEADRGIMGDSLFGGRATGLLSLAVGNPFVLAETPVILPDMLTEVAELSWVVKSAIHTINGENGKYTTAIDIQTEEAME